VKYSVPDFLNQLIFLTVVLKIVVDC
jgi:hypothetical protein